MPIEVVLVPDNGPRFVQQTEIAVNGGLTEADVNVEIPPNVRHALNLYQDSGLVLEGEHPIEAEDPSRTRLLGNWHFDYNGPPGSTISVDGLPPWKLFLRVAHAKMDRDPRVWESVGAMLTGACEGQDLRGLAERVQETLR